MQAGCVHSCGMSNMLARQLAKYPRGGGLLAASIAGILNCWFLVHKLLMDWRQHGRLRMRASVDTLLGCILVLGPYILMQGEAVSPCCMAPAKWKLVVAPCNPED